MQLVDVERLVEAGAAPGHPLLVVPLKREVAHDGAVPGSQVHAVAVRIAVLDGLVVAGELVGIGGTRPQPTDVRLPEVAVGDLGHGVQLAFQQQLDLVGSGSEGAESHAVLSEKSSEHEMGVELLTGIEVARVHCVSVHLSFLSFILRL